MYNGALADMALTTDPFTGNRYTFGAGNPITNIELDGHTQCDAGYCPTWQQTQQVTQAAARYGAGCPPTRIGCPGYIRPPPSPANDTGPGGGYCTQIEFKLGACASERGAAGTTPEQVKQSLIGAGIVVLGTLPIGDAIGGLLGLFKGQLQPQKTPARLSRGR